jgi:hypothetical protein
VLRGDIQFTKLSPADLLPKEMRSRRVRITSSA